jgi:hypothetical protein
MKKRSFLWVVVFLMVPLFLSGCDERGFDTNDIKNSFCGVHINYQYCKCAFHGEFCKDIGMSKSEAKNHVYDEYEKWKEGGLDDFKKKCLENNGFVTGNSCYKCNQDQVVRDNRCVSVDEVNPEETIEEEEEAVTEEAQTCKYDSDCDPICEEDVRWKMGCNAISNTCEKTFDNDCSVDIETFGEQSFPKVCIEGECARDEESIGNFKAKLTHEKELWIDAGKQINAVRPELNSAMLLANKNCINGIADMTNVAIMEFATRVSSVLAGGIPDVASMTASAADTASGLISEQVKNLAGAAGDYVGEALNRLYNYQKGEPVEAEKKLAPHEYIKLNCDLYHYFNEVQAESDKDLQTALDNAKEADRLLKELP